MKQIACPSCSAKFDVSSQPAGKKFRCGRCKNILTVPEDEPESALDRTVDAHIKTLRAKLRAIRDDDPIETHRGLGYSIRGKAS